MKMSDNLQKYKDLVSKLSALLEDPQPGLISWASCFRSLVMDLIRLWFGGKLSSIAGLVKEIVKDLPDEERAKKLKWFFDECRDGRCVQCGAKLVERGGRMVCYCWREFDE